MRLNIGYRVQAVALLALVALLGALAGVLVDRALNRRAQESGELAAPFPAGPSPRPGVWRWEPRPAARYADLLSARLELSAEQRAEIDRILAEEQLRVRELTREVGPQFRSVAEQTRARIEIVLTDAQREQLHSLRQERIRGRRMRGPGAGETPALRTR